MKKNFIKNSQYFLNDIPLKKYIWDQTNLWEISEKKGRVFFHLLYDRLKESINIPDVINPPFLIAFSTLNRVFRYLITTYFSDFREDQKIVNKLFFNSLIRNFVNSYPPKDYKKDTDINSYIKEKDSEDFRKLILNELIILKITEENPALHRCRELFIDEDFLNNELFRKIIQYIENDNKLRPYKGTNIPLLDLLREPLKKSPSSIYDQLNYIKERFRYFIPEELLEDIIISLDIIKEYETIRTGERGPQEVIKFDKEDHLIEPEKFTPDTHWMPEVVLIAKLIYVWLYQLSKKYSKDIKRLDEIPDEELDILRDWGFNALWLIGIWERSPASKKIKHLMGNLSAHSSAYSLYDYVIAEDLGGESAFNNLKERALKRGIRLASDMVPNHTGIYSKWIIEHPDWFIQSDYPPFPKYSFTKHNLSDHPDIEIYIEDGYYDKSDASVVFKFVDKRDGKIRYIYHGNDGTSTPWNDTAQLNYLMKEVRESVIQTILYVAKKTPIIRFDAAMTLTKRHFQRLWFPMPGQGGNIPSRADYSLPKEVFDRLMPEEFWREVVDRISQEAGDTLLLAEAFWLLEGYFVRSLGMHRVYNSAFMNMLKDEENAKYRQIIKNILHFNPEILKRFVNFMSNPDEQTAIEQFGTGDKYLGVCTLLVTMPGLPMFAHGQVEGFREKYGMEFYQSFWDEKPNEHLVELHKKYIFPLMKKRYLFSDSKNFHLYDFVTDFGVDEDVFAYSNLFFDEKTIVIYNNKYKNTKGYIKTSSEKMIKNRDKDSQHTKKDIFYALNLKSGDNLYYLFENMRDNRFYLKSSNDILNEGLFFELSAYQCIVLLNIREIIDEDGTISKIYKDYKNRFFDDFEQTCLEIRYKEKLSKILDLTNLKYGQLNKIFELISELTSLNISELEDKIATLKDSLKDFESFLDKKVNYKLINLVLIDFFLRFFNTSLYEYLNNIGGIKFLKRNDENFSLYFLTLSEILECKITFDNKSLLEFLSTNKTIQNFVMLHNFEGKKYFNKERFEDLVASIYILNIDKNISIEKLEFWVSSAIKSGYDIDLLIKTVIPEGKRETVS